MDITPVGGRARVWDAQASGENRKLGATVDDPFRQAALNSAISEAVSQSPGAHIIDLRSYLCPNGKYEDLIDGVQLRPDSVHPSEVGSERIWNLMLRRIAETWKPPQSVTTKPS